MAAKPTQVLGYVEEKLRRVFNLAGPIGVTLKPEVSPVILVDDLRDPGHAFYQGRGWIWSYSSYPPVTTAGVYRGHTIQFRDDVVIEYAWMAGTLKAGVMTVLMYLTGPDEATPTTPSSTTGAWRDRRTNPTDVPPLLENPGWEAITGTQSTKENVIIGFAASSYDQTMPGVMPVKAFVPRGGCLTWRVESWPSTSDAFNIGLSGRVFPQ
jgi:hypothetical protein